MDSRRYLAFLHFDDGTCEMLWSPEAFKYLTGYEKRSAEQGFITKDDLLDDRKAEVRFELKREGLVCLEYGQISS